MLSKNDQIEQLTELNDELENYFRNTIIPQLFVDSDLILQKFTPPAMRQFNLATDDVGKSIVDIKDNFRFHTIAEDIQQVIEANEILEKEVQTNDLRWYQMNIIPYVEIKSNKTNGVIITFIEITMRINDLKDQEKLVADHEILLDTISHDIKSPLTSLVLSIEVFKNVAFENPAQFKPLLTNVESSLKKMQNLINELTDRRKGQHKYRADEQLLNFANIWEDVRLLIMDNIKQSGAVIKTEINVTDIMFSKTKLRSVIYNLVSNAIKFRSPERRLEIFIKTEREENFIIISIKDNGIGIDAAKEDAIFSKYFRVENKIEGSGIGLYLVKEIVTNSGGKVELQSRLGMGSEFKVLLKAN